MAFMGGNLGHHSDPDDFSWGDTASGFEREGQGMNGVKLILYGTEWPLLDQPSHAGGKYNGQPVGGDSNFLTSPQHTCTKVFK